MNGTIPDGHSVLIFATVAKYLSFRRAAEALGLPPATVSRKLAELERRLGVQLLQRTTRQVSLTPVGQEWLAEIGPPLMALQQATERLSEAQQSPSGTVRITTTTVLAESNILPVLPILQQDYPGIRLDIVLAETVVDLRFESIDLAIRAGKVRDTSLVARLLGQHEFAHYTTPAWLSHPAPPQLRYDDDFDQSGEAWVQIQAMDLLQKMVLSGLGEAYLLRFLCAEQERQGQLIERVGSPRKCFDFFLVYPSRHYISQKVKIVRDLIIDHAKAQS